MKLGKARIGGKIGYRGEEEPVDEKRQMHGAGTEMQDRHLQGKTWLFVGRVL